MKSSWSLPYVSTTPAYPAYWYSWYCRSLIWGTVWDWDRSYSSGFIICPEQMIFDFFSLHYLQQQGGRFSPFLLIILVPTWDLLLLSTTRVDICHIRYSQSLQYCVSIVSERPWSNLTLVSVIIFKNLETHKAISVFAGQRIDISWCSGLIPTKFGKREVILPKKQFLLIAKVLHCKIACFSSSILLSEQYLQILEIIGVTGLV